MKFAIAQANPAPAVKPVVVAATRLHLSPHDRAHSEADGSADCRTASATRDATDRGARQAPAMAPLPMNAAAHWHLPKERQRETRALRLRE